MFFVFWSVLFCFFTFLFIHFRKEGRARNINLLFHLFMHSLVDSLFLKKDLFSDREEGREKKGRETLMCERNQLVASWGPGLQPRHVP